MYKSRLQELCHQRLWALPEYTSTRGGPDHNPRFRATVTVNGVSFHAADLSKTSKEAQNKAAQAAVEHFASTGKHFASAGPSLSPPRPSSFENQMSYKSQLQIFVQRNSVDPPIYTFVREGLPHAPRFKAAVTVDGKTFQSSQYFSTLKEAEHDAAKVALMSFPSEENQQVETGFYKNLLQELAHKEGISLPKYTTVRGGASHMPIFSSTVEIGGESFEGDIAKSKKQAEINAAKFALCALNERKENQMSYKSQLQIFVQRNSVDPPIYTFVREGLPHAPRFKAAVTVDGKTFQSSQYFSTLKEAEHDAAKVALMSFPSEENQQVETGFYKNLLQELAHKEGISLPKYTTVKGGAYHMPIFSSTVEIGGESFEGEVAKSKKQAEINAAKVALCVLNERKDKLDSTTAEFLKGEGTCSLLSNRIRVHPGKPDMVLPESTTLLPFSDDLWVAINSDFSN